MLFVSVKCRVVGFHCWPDAPEKFSYLRHRHRHEFVITCKKTVCNADREVEVNELKEDIEHYLYGKYGNPCEFNHMACEHLAQEILEEFNLSSCEVLEDGFNGAVAVTEGSSCIE